MDRPRFGYQAYTLRLLWSAASGQWQMTLYSAQTGERLCFTDVEQLSNFLRQATTMTAFPPEPPADVAE